jgi:hypothetical protein
VTRPLALASTPSYVSGITSGEIRSFHAAIILAFGFVDRHGVGLIGFPKLLAGPFLIVPVSVRMILHSELPEGMPCFLSFSFPRNTKGGAVISRAAIHPPKVIPAIRVCLDSRSGRTTGILTPESPDDIVKMAIRILHEV